MFAAPLISARESGRLVPALDRKSLITATQLSTFQPADQTEALLVLRLAGVNMDCHPYCSPTPKSKAITNA